MPKYYIKTATTETNLDPAPIGFIIGGAGDVKIASNGAWVTIVSAALIVGFPYLIPFTQMDADRTTATNIYFLYDVER